MTQSSLDEWMCVASVRPNFFIALNPHKSQVQLSQQETEKHFVLWRAFGIPQNSGYFSKPLLVVVPLNVLHLQLCKQFTAHLSNKSQRTTVSANKTLGDNRMNGFYLIVPLIVIRFGLLRLLNKDALRRAAFFAPVVGTESVAASIYQLSNFLVMMWPFFLKVSANSRWFFAGLVVYAIGVCFCCVAVICFAKPAKNGFSSKGIYRISRNPMYVGYFLYFFGCVLLTQSLILLAILVVFQVSAHWIVLSEERWCRESFGKEYEEYMKKVRRYL